MLLLLLLLLLLLGPPFEVGAGKEEVECTDVRDEEEEEEEEEAVDPVMVLLVEVGIWSEEEEEVEVGVTLFTPAASKSWGIWSSPKCAPVAMSTMIGIPPVVDCMRAVPGGSVTLMETDP